MKKILIKMLFVTVLAAALFPVSGKAISGDEALQAFRGRMSSIGSLEGTLTMKYSSGSLQTGQFKFMSPGKFIIKFTNPSGKVICSNGRKLWVYDPSSAICGIQELIPGSLSGGIAGMLNGYMAIASSSGSDYTIKLKGTGKGYTNINILADRNFMLKKVSFFSERGEGLEVSLSNVRTNPGLHAGLFEFNVPTSCLIVKDPLNVR